MTKTTTYNCDISGEVHNVDVLSGVTVNVIMLTDETEGRAVDGYLTEKKLDLCWDCRDKIIETHEIPQARGAMGNYRYNFKSTEDATRMVQV